MMPEHELYNTRTPGDAITVVPTSLEYVFDAPNGTDIFGVLCGDNRLGHFMLCLSPSVAAHIIAHLASMLADIDNLRAKAQREREQHE